MDHIVTFCCSRHKKVDFSNKSEPDFLALPDLMTQGAKHEAMINRVHAALLPKAAGNETNAENNEDRWMQLKGKF